MSREKWRAVVQVFLLLLMLLGIGATGSGDSCCSTSIRKGSDYNQIYDAVGHSATAATDAALVQRWHDLNIADSALNAKDLASLRDWLPGNVIIGLHVPTAPGASGPGTLSGDRQELVLGFGGQWGEYDIQLVADDGRASQIARVLPPDAGAHWQALVPANDDYVASIPTETTTFSGGSGFLYYRLDFHDAADWCNGCTVKLTFCTPTDSVPGGLFTSSLLLGSALKDIGIRSDECLTCLDPILTVIRLGHGEPLPSLLAAWLSPWGGPVFETTRDPRVDLEYTLGHSSPDTETFNLEPIHSARGWSYAWRDLDDDPITQMQIEPNTEAWTTNIKVIGTVPTNALGFDTIHLTATCATDPSLYAVATSHVGRYPDPNEFVVADLGISKVASTEVISAGQSVDFTLTITNYEEVAVSAVVTDTLSSERAIGDVILPPGCERDGAEIICQISDLPPGESTTVVYTVQTARGFAGILSNSAEVEPAEGVDARGYDNRAGPVAVTVEGVIVPLYLPLVVKP